MRLSSIASIAILLAASGWSGSLNATEAKGDSKGRTPAPNYSRVNVKGIVAAIEPDDDALFLEMPNGTEKSIREIACHSYKMAAAELRMSSWTIDKSFLE